MRQLPFPVESYKGISFFVLPHLCAVTSVASLVEI